MWIVLYLIIAIFFGWIFLVFEHGNTAYMIMQDHVRIFGYALIWPIVIVYVLYEAST